MRKSILCTVILLFTIIMIENAILSNIAVLPVVPDLLMICIIYLGLLNGKIDGELSGFFSGMVQDFLSGVPFGFFMMLRTILGYMGGFFHGSLHFRGIVMPGAIIFIATISKCLIIWIMSLFFPHYVSTYNAISFSFLFEIIANSVLAPLMFKVLSFFDRFLAFHKDNNE